MVENANETTLTFEKLITFERIKNKKITANFKVKVNDD